MRKIFLPLLICALTANTAEAKIKWTTGKNTECFRSIDGAKQSTVQYYFCGHQTKSCYGLAWIGTHKTPQWMVEGDGKYVEKDDTKWWCCGGTGGEKEGETGTFKSGAQWSTTVEVTKEVGGGTCTYKKTTNVCGGVSGTECTVPTKCPSGQVVRDGKCAAAKQETPKTTETKKEDTPKTTETKTETPKPADSGKKITASDECKSTEYKSPLSEKCVLKSKNVQYSSDMMHECYGCSSDVRFKNCLNIYRAAPDKPTSTQEGTLKACNVTYAAADAQLMKTELVGKLPVFTKLDLSNSLINKKLSETTAMKVSDDELKGSLQQQMQVADVVAVADQVAMDDIVVPKTTGTTATTGTSVASSVTSIADAVKDIALPTGIAAPKLKLDYTTALPAL